MHVQRFGAGEFRAEILAAATVCLVYDPQSEGLRTKWLAELCAAAGIVAEVIAHPVSKEWRDRQQRCELLAEFCRRGFDAARAPLYAACVRGSEVTSEVDACREIIELDGEAGLLFVARKLATIRAEFKDGFRVSGYEIYVFDECCGAPRGRALLEQVGMTDPLIRAYLDAVATAETREARRAKQTARPRPLRPTLPSDPRVRLEGLTGCAHLDNAEAVLAALVSMHGKHDLHDLHHAFSWALDLLKESPEVRDARIPLHIYEHTPCMSCREDAVMLLDAWQACPRWIVDECAHDGSESICLLAPR